MDQLNTPPNNEPTGIHGQSYDLDENVIERLVRRFYDNIRGDEVLGPIFAAHISDWEPHLQRMFAFWSSVMLTSGRYHGRPMEKHIKLPIDARHFDRWLSIFERTAQATCTSAVAEVFVNRAHRIATSLEMGKADSQGFMLAKGQRFIDPTLSD